MKYFNSITSSLMVFVLVLSPVFGSPIFNGANSTLDEYDVRAKRGVAVCTKGFSTDRSGNSVCNGDSSGNRRQASELDCVFPFIYNGAWRDTCIQDGKQFLWCSLDKSYANRYARCEQECPLLTRLVMQKEPGQVHSTCLNPTAGSQALIPTANEQQVILNAHNTVRSSVNPTASNMKLLTWDDSLSRVALRWAQYCQFRHDCDTCRKLPNARTIAIGQNAFASSGVAYDQNFWQTVVSSWANEVQYFRYGFGSTTGNWENVGHYTQIVSSEVVRVGCAAAQCGGSIYAYCNYIGAQLKVETPYESGSPCSKCAPGYCQNNMCRCNKFCQNNGKLDAASCTCQCPAYAAGSECETLVCDKSDKEYGCWGSDPSYCAYANTAPMCPKLCGICNYN